MQTFKKLLQKKHEHSLFISLMSKTDYDKPKVKNINI
jgi:hypothetical protein